MLRLKKILSSILILVLLGSSSLMMYVGEAEAAVTFGSKQTYVTPGGGQQALYNPSVTLDSTRFVVAYRDANDLDYGKVVIGTKSGSSVSYGSTVTFNSADTRFPSLAKIDSNTFAIAFRDGGDSNRGHAMICTVSGGDVISCGSEYTFNSATTAGISVKAIDSTHIAISFANGSTNGRAIIGTISATTVITFGTAVTFKGSGIQESHVATLDSTHFVVVYQDASTQVVLSIIGVVSGGTTITFGSEVSVFASASNSSWVSVIDSTHFLVGYHDGVASLASANVGTVASGNVITIGTKYSAASNLNSNITIEAMSSTSFFFAGIVSDTISVITGTISGSALTFDTAVTADGGMNGHLGASFFDSSSMVVTYSNTDSTPVGTAKIGTISSPSTSPRLVIDTVVSTNVKMINGVNYSSIKKINNVTSN